MPPQNRFWYSVPMVMLTSDTPDASQPQPASPPSCRLCRISTTPPSPSSSPAHCSGVTRSPSQRLASVEVRIGCSPGISADSPAGTECAIAIAVPAR